MKNNFKSLDEATAALREIGTLECFGRNFDYYVFTFTHKDGRKFELDIYLNGHIRVLKEVKTWGSISWD